MSEADSHEVIVPRTMSEIVAPLVAIIVGMFMVILDSTAVNVAIPSLIKDFNSTLSTVRWTVTGYMLAQAAVIPLAGWLSDRFGAKKIFLISIGLFTMGSLLCGLAGSIDQLVLFRIIQGVGGGMVMPIALSYVYKLSPPDKVGAVMGILGVPILLAPALGPIISGYLVDNVGWKWIFYINLPIGVLGVFLGMITLPTIKKSAVAALDILGIILGPLAFASIVYGVSEGGTSWNSAKTISGLCFGAALLILFIIVELTRKKQPLLELRVFKSFSFTQGIVIQWISQIALFGTIFMIPQLLQQVKGFTAFHSGLTVLPQAIAAGIFMIIGGKLFDKFGAKFVVPAGMTLMAVAAFLISRIALGEINSITMIFPLALIGAGMGLSMMPLSTHLLQAAPQNLVSRVSSLTSASQQIMNAFAVAGLSTILSNQIKHNLTSGHNKLDSMTSAFSFTYIIVAIIAILGIAISLFLRKPKPISSGEQSGQAAEAAVSMASH